MEITSKIIETRKVKAQASPASTTGLTRLKIYDAIYEVTEYTTKYPIQYSQATYTKISTEKIYTVVDNSGITRKFGSEFFREVK